MIKCNSPYSCYKKCIFDMNALETQGGTIVCDIAEECDSAEEVLYACEYAEQEN